MKLLLILSILVISSSCDVQTSPFETTTSKYVPKFAEGGSRVCLLSFTADPRLSQKGSGGPLQALKQKAADPTAGKTDIPETVLRRRYSQYVAELSSKYQVVGTT